MFQIFLFLLLAIAHSHPPVNYKPVLKLPNDLHLEEYVDIQYWKTVFLVRPEFSILETKE